jgi:hypothetical protein
LDKANGIGNSELKLTAAQNYTGERIAKVTVKAENSSRILTITQSLAKKNIVIKKCTTALVIDGDDSDWPEFVVENSLTEAKYWRATNNNTVTYKMAYDDSFVYVAVKVLDANIDTVQSPYEWEKDNVTLYFVMNDNIPEGTSYYSGINGSWIFRKIYGRELKYYYNDVYTPIAELGIIVSEKDITGGYMQEWKLPWDILASPLYGGQWGGKMFRFECENDDNDGTGRGMLFWNSNADDQWKTIKNQGFVYLSNYPFNNIILSSSIFNVEADSKTYSLEVYASDSWTVQSNKSWLTIDNTSGEGNSIIMFTVSENYSELAREAKITVSKGNMSKVVVVTQAGILCSTLLTRTKNELQEARDSINMLLDKVARYDSITVAVIEMKDFTTLVKLSETNIRLKLFPNPTKDKVIIECESLISKIEIYNIEGQKVYDKLSSDNTSYLRLDGFKEGTYILKVHTEKGIIGGKFVITK